MEESQEKVDIFAPELIEISKHAFSEEPACIEHLLPETVIFSAKAEDIQSRAERYVKSIRENKVDAGIESFLQQYKLGTNEGITIMCLAEALLRIPDKKTANELITDRLRAADWEQHLGKSKSLFVNASSWGMMLTGKISLLGDLPKDSVGGVLGKLISKLGEPIIREALKQAMQIISTQFVIAQNITEAIKKGKEYGDKGYLMSYDILGEGARTSGQAQVYYQSYINAVQEVSNSDNKTSPLLERPSVSVKLSALHPRYELLKTDRLLNEVLPRIKTIAMKAMECGISLSIDAEETFRLDSSLIIYKQLLQDSEFADYDGIGFVLQAYQKRAFYIVEHLVDLAKKNKKRIPIRLVKGAYWDHEIKRAQELGLSTYPVFTRKSHTDVSYLACAGRILEESDLFYPQFATHNALSVASIMEVAGSKKYEFQRLYGMGETFYDQLVEKMPCRIYAPVGEHEELLPYLIRRLLENGANTSFVNILLDKDQTINQILSDPITKAIRNEGYTNPATPLPLEIYPDRKNSLGADLGNLNQLRKFEQLFEDYKEHHWQGFSIIDGREVESEKIPITCPFDRQKEIGKVSYASGDEARNAIESASHSFAKWSQTPVSQRCKMAEKIADLIEERKNELAALCIYEGGRTLKDTIAEIREAVDFCRYYAATARKNFEIPRIMAGPTGEKNALSYHGRGVFVCISPWNFPLAILTGQAVAALLAGNTVVAKPAQQTSLIASYIVKLMHEAGIPKNVLQLVIGSGSKLGPTLISDKNIGGVAFTGSTETARSINKALAKRKGPVVPFIAETGGQNSMIVDSSSLPEQVIDDIVVSAFGSAGQRCSSLRVLYIQDDIADKYITMLTGAVQELEIGRADRLSTDIGPIIDEQAKQNLVEHIEKMKMKAQFISSGTIDEATEECGSFVAPHIYEISSITKLKREIFGPILHIIRFKGTELDKVIDEINSTGYGLTFGIHSRIEQKIEYIRDRIRAGNTYVNRSMIGAVVGVQPFGGEGLSGTGPKAGGPNYLIKFATERTTSINTVAIGGNITLVS